MKMAPFTENLPAGRPEAQFHPPFTSLQWHIATFSYFFVSPRRSWLIEHNGHCAFNDYFAYFSASIKEIWSELPLYNCTKAVADEWTFHKPWGIHFSFLDIYNKLQKGLRKFFFFFLISLPRTLKRNNLSKTIFRPHLLFLTSRTKAIYLVTLTRRQNSIIFIPYLLRYAPNEPLFLLSVFPSDLLFWPHPR